jgi:hypothetical protein
MDPFVYFPRQRLIVCVEVSRCDRDFVQQTDTE